METTTASREEALEKRRQRMQSLVETGRGTSMGSLLRKFWHPIAVSDQLQRGKALPIKIMNEELTLYRGESNKPYLVAGRCAHRQTLLHTGWVEGEFIRCMYHGWQYNGEGRCVHQPAEREPRKCNVKISSYPVREYGGLVFGYLGEGEPPDFDFMQRPEIDAKDALVFARSETWDCNWVQHLENSLDAVHVSFAHQTGKVGVFGDAISEDVPELQYNETDSGICQLATRPGNRVRVSDWTFPNCNRVMIPGLAAGDPWFFVNHWMVPHDDVRTSRLAIIATQSTNPETDKRISDYFAGCRHYDAADHHAALFRGEYPSDPLIELTSAQDYVALMGQGPIADRTKEWLGRSDAGIAKVRTIFWREMDAMRQGQAGKAWRRTPNAVELTAGARQSA
jgi:nitrite reductase/ring-hydroxylating ferredoxin subunit